MTEIQSHSARCEVHELLSSTFDRLMDAFSVACKRTGSHGRWMDLDGHAVRFIAAGSRLSEALIPALAHLPVLMDGTKPSLEIFAWDEAESGIAPPQLPWSWAAIEGTVRLVLPPGGEAFRIHAYEEGVMFFMYCVETHRAVFWTRDTRLLPSYFRAAPFLTLVHWWCRDVGLRLVHAGCVGAADGAALIAGKGGSGKSTTSLLCVEAGMDYLSDDFCLIRSRPEPTAISLFNSGKLHRDHFQRFPDLAARSVDPVPDVFDKPLIFMQEHFPNQTKNRLPLRTVIVPQVSGEEHTRWEPLSPAVALRALTSSTMFQFSPDDGTAFRDTAATLRGLRCYRLHLGTMTGEIPPAVQEILKASSQ